MMNKLKKSFLGLAAIFGAFTCSNAENVMMHTPTNFQVLSLSPNGKWACGVFMDGSMNTFAFRWNLESGSIEMLGTQTSLAWDVANDGTISGEFQDTEASPNGAPIILPGFWRDGAWHHLQMPEGSVTEGLGATISPDGHYMTGSVCVNGLYTPFIWKDGQIHRSLNTGKDAVSYAVSPDGNTAAGFSTQKNRTACYWPTDDKPVFFMDSKDHSQSPWNYARNFSPDGSKLVYWGGWDVVSADEVYLYSIYDTNTGERIKVKSPAYESDLEFFDVSNRGTLVGQDRGRGYIWVDGHGMYIDDYLAMRGVDMSKFDDFYTGTDYFVGQLPIYNIVALSEDENVYAMTYYERDGDQRSLVVKIDQDFSAIKPVDVKASQLSGLSTVALTWKRPVGVTSLKGYNVYRDGKKVSGFLPLNVPYFYDTKLSEGTYKYEVSAITSGGVETRCDEMLVEVKANALEAPVAPFTRQKGATNAYVSWDKPFENVAHKRYYQPGEEYVAFSIYQPMEVELAVRYDKAEIANYNGHKLTDVSFYPMAEQNAWAIKVYTKNADGKLQLLASQSITQPLKYGELNTITLDTPVDLPAGDLYVAINVLTREDVYATIGAESGNVTSGYSDLLRQPSDDDFFSAYESSIEGAISISCFSWALDLGLTPTAAGEKPVLSHYNVYLGAEKVGQTTDTSYVINDVPQGTYEVTVEAVYADGTISAPVATTLNMATARLAVTDVSVESPQSAPSTVKATWSTPADYDVTELTYSKNREYGMGIKGNESNSYALMIGADYPKNMVRGYDGYKVESLSFYPLADAIYTFIIYENDQEVYTLEVDDYVKGELNEIKVPDDVIINEKSSYRLVVDCFDPEPDVPVLAIDNEPPYSFISDNFSIDNGETWSSLTTETGARGNWIIGMKLQSPTQLPVAVDGYDVVVDGKVCNTTRINSNTYSHDMGTTDNADHTLNVDIYYKGSDTGVRGDTYIFRLGESGISDASIAEITLAQHDNYLKVVGEGVVAVTMYTAAGAMVAASHTDTIDISAATSGIYLISVETTTATITRKVNIKR